MTDRHNGEKYSIHIISHTHWDREWYLNSRYTNEWLITFFDNLFDMLEREEEYIFVLDGQTAMIEDYFTELEKRGINSDIGKEKIRTFVKQKRLFVGPYFLQPDWQLLSEESLVRNLLIGSRIADDLGGRMNTGWLLDNFGQISQTAQIHSEFGLKGLFVWRGVEMDPGDVHSEFLWKSPDGTVLPSIYLLDSYRNVMRLAEYSNIMKQRVEDEIRKLKPFATTHNILLMNGYDQEMIPDDLQPYLKKKILDTENRTVFQSNPEAYLDAVLSCRPELKVLEGPLYSGRFIAVFPGVMSSRMYLKLQNDELQKYIEKEMEPLSVISWALGGEYGRQIITETWKTLLRNHPHDSICGVSIDDVHRDMEDRFITVKQLALSQIKKKLEEITGLIDTSDGPAEDVPVVINPSPFPRNEVITRNGSIYFLKDIPPMGYVTAAEDVSEDTIKFGDLSAENRYVKLSVNPNGSFSVIHKETGIEYPDLGLFEDKADAGDEYNYSHPDTDKVITSDKCRAAVSLAVKERMKAVFKVEIVMDIPESCEDNYSKRSTSTRRMPVVSYITLDAESPVVKCRTLLKNTVKDHIFRVKFPTNIDTEFSYAGSPFDITKRPVKIDDYDESTIPGHVKEVIIGAREASPNTTFLNRELVDINNGRYGLAVLSKGLPEYQITGEDNSIDLTLFRSVGWIARDINSRIGDAGPEIFTPEAQCLREMTFEYGVYPHSGDTYSGRVCREADIFNTPLIILSTGRHKGPLESKCSFFGISDGKNSFKMTALKQSEDGRGIIIRGYNSDEHQTVLTVKSFFRILRAYRTNLMENIQEELPVTNGTITLKAEPKKIITLKLEIERKSLRIPEYTRITRTDSHPREDFSSYSSVKPVTEEDLDRENSRYKKLSEKMNDPMITRTALEARLSAILTQNRLNEAETKELGYKLNEARVHRRILDYIKDYET